VPAIPRRGSSTTTPQSRLSCAGSRPSAALLRPPLRHDSGPLWGLAVVAGINGSDTGEMSSGQVNGHLNEETMTIGDNMNTDLKNLLTELVNAGYPTHRLGHFARIEIEAA
jgi:hypothetical protein